MALAVISTGGNRLVRYKGAVGGWGEARLTFIQCPLVPLNLLLQACITDTKILFFKKAQSSHSVTCPISAFRSLFTGL